MTISSLRLAVVAVHCILLGNASRGWHYRDGFIVDVSRIVFAVAGRNPCHRTALCLLDYRVSLSRVRTKCLYNLALCVHPVPWLSVTDHGRLALTNPRCLGVTRVSQVGTFGPGLGWTVRHEKRCE